MYKCLLVTGEYSTRQARANEAKAALYLECHYNSTPGAQGTFCIVTDTASRLTRQIARAISSTIATNISKAPLMGDRGVVVVDKTERGYGNLVRTRMPAVLLEPWFIDTEAWADKAISSGEALGDAVFDVIKQFIPVGSTIALSLGHKGKPSKPSDRGALGGNGKWEADLAYIYYNRLYQRLIGEVSTTPRTQEEIKASEEAEPWYVDAMQYMKTNRLYTEDRPNDYITRAEVAAVIQKLKAP